MRFAVIIALAALCGCARYAGGQAAAGALAAIRQKSDEAPEGQKPAEIAARRVVDGALKHLSEPEQMQILRTLAGDTASAAVRQAMSAALEGPGAERLVATAKETSSSVVDGAILRLFPECTEDNEGCLSARMRDLGREAASGFMVGVRNEIGRLPVILAFGAGVFVALLLTLVVPIMSRYGHRRAPTEGAHPRGSAGVQPSRP
jgi:hypothetical protein